MARLTLLIVALALVLAAPSDAAEKVTDRDRFNLWTGCGSVELVVEGLSPDAAKIGLRKEAIATAVRSRLRGARLYADLAYRKLYVRVTVVGDAFGVDFELLRYASSVIWLLPPWVKGKEAEARSGTVTTWQKGITGTHVGASGHILSSVERVTDIFIDEYLRVNASACRKWERFRP